MDEEKPGFWPGFFSGQFVKQNNNQKFSYSREELNGMLDKAMAASAR